MHPTTYQHFPCLRFDIVLQLHKMMYQTVPQSPRVISMLPIYPCRLSCNTSPCACIHCHSCHISPAAHCSHPSQLAAVFHSTCCTVQFPSLPTTVQRKPFIKKTTTLLSSSFQVTRLQPRRKRRGCCRVLFNFQYFHSFFAPAKGSAAGRPTRPMHRRHGTMDPEVRCD